MISLLPLGHFPSAGVPLSAVGVDDIWNDCTTRRPKHDIHPRVMQAVDVWTVHLTDRRIDASMHRRT